MNDTQQQGANLELPRDPISDRIAVTGYWLGNVVILVGFFPSIKVEGLRIAIRIDFWETWWNLLGLIFLWWLVWSLWLFQRSLSRP